MPDEWHAMAGSYNEKAQATGWQGPAVVFGIAFKYTKLARLSWISGVAPALAQRYSTRPV